MQDHKSKMKNDVFDKMDRIIHDLEINEKKSEIQVFLNGYTIEIYSKGRLVESLATRPKNS